TRGEVAQALLSVVSEKTGYPAESLSLALSLDADLGVDSIKRVEILAALQERLPGAPQVKPEHLGTLHTLQAVADFLPASPSVLARPTTKTPLVARVVATPALSTAEMAAPDTEHVSSARPVKPTDSALPPPVDPDVAKSARPTPVPAPVTIRQPV